MHLVTMKLHDCCIVANGMIFNSNDTIYTARCELIPIQATSNNGFDVSVEDMQLTYNYATQSMMKRIKAIILCSPNNPLGRT